jgi:hypothetical protein
MVEFGADLSFAYVMGGLAREFSDGVAERMALWLENSEESGMPLDPGLWTEGPIGSSYPACMAVKAAAEQGIEAQERYLRALREGLMCFRRKLDTTEALVEEARRARLDVGRFRVDLGSHAIVEAFGADLDRVRDIPEAARGVDGAVSEGEVHERLTLPTLAFEPEDGSDPEWVFGLEPYESYRAAADAAGARRSEGAPPDPLAAIGRFGRMATREVQEVCGLPEPRAGAELWRLASEWQLRAVPVLAAHLWEPA